MGATVPVDSSAIDAVGNDDARRELHVAYKGGRAYAYLDVPREVYDALLDAPSKGAFVNAEVKPRYRFRTPYRREGSASKPGRKGSGPRAGGSRGS